MIEQFAQTAETGDLFVFNGIDTPLRWDGFLPGFDQVGIAPPVSALTLGGSGAGPIVGTYFAFQRFLDAQGNPSNLSPISNTYTAQGTTGTITNVANATPFVVTSPGHGLPNGATVKITGVGGIDTVNNTWIITVINNNSFSLNTSTGDGVTPYTGGGTWISGITTISYTNVPTPTQAKVVRRQILRNTDGQATTFYVDVDTTNLVATSFTSTQTDTFLQAGISVPLLDTQGNIFANTHDQPQTFFPFIAQHQDRMFNWGNVEYNIGSCKVVLGSSLVQGVGTSWDAGLAGRFLYVIGASKIYQIQSINSPTSLTLISPWTDQSNNFTQYSIKPPPADRLIVQYTPAGEPQSWPPTYGFQIQETNDELTGGFTKDAFLYFTKQRHVHKFTFSTDPAIDGDVFMASSRGTITSRCAVVVDQYAYLLDELGVYRFIGNSDVEPLSAQIQSIFRTDIEDEDFFKINWTWKENFHAVLDRQRDTIRWFVCLDGNRYPRHALCLNYKSTRWWIEELPFPIGGACVGYMLGLPQVFYGGQHGHVYAAWNGTLDLASPARGTVQNNVSAATSFTLTDTLASFDPGIINAQVAIVEGTGKGQTRRILSVIGQTLNVDMPWFPIPDSTSIYQIGGIRYLYRSQALRFNPATTHQDQRFEIMLEPLQEPAKADLRFYLDFAQNAEKSIVTQSYGDGGGIAANAGDGNYVIDLTYTDNDGQATGLYQKQRPKTDDYFLRHHRYLQFEIEGFSNAEQISIFQWSYEGATTPGTQT